MTNPTPSPRGSIRTPDQRLRVFVSSTLAELADERAAARRAIEQLRLTPVMFELGARPHPPRELYRAYLDQSDVFVGIYGRSYGWVAPGETTSGLEDEFRLGAALPRLLYVKAVGDREPRLESILEDVRRTGDASYKVFVDAAELSRLLAEDLATLLSERFARPPDTEPTIGHATASRPLRPDVPLVGRDDALHAASDLLDDPSVRLVTLTGAPGIGKSRLALELALQLEDRFPDGVWTVLLESVRDPEHVLPAVAAALGVETSAVRPLEALTVSLAPRRCLLVLDNFEHLTAQATDLAELLASCPGIRCLVTSRVPLHLRGEHELPLTPLEVPTDPRHDPPERLAASPAVQLFLQRARASDPGFDLDDEQDLRAAAAICRRLDGLPLAIELAAARLRLLPPQALLERLDDRLGVLTQGLADAPARHRTLRTAIDWGHDLLDTPERTALRRLAVFAGGWTLGAAEAVLPAAGPPGGEVLDLLDALLAHHFVTRVATSGPDPRYTMLGVIREYALERLADSGELGTTAAAHATHFLGLAERAAPELHGPEQATWMDALERDHANLRAAFRWFDDRGDADEAARLVAAAGRFLMVRGHVEEAAAGLDRALALTAGRRDRVRAELLSWAGWTSHVLGDADRVVALHTEALAIRRQLGDRHGENIEVMSLGIAAFDAGDLATAEQRWREALALAEASGDDDIVGRTTGNLGVVARIRDDPERARQAFERARRLHATAGEPHAEVLAAANLAGALLDLQRHREAAAVLADALELAAQVGDRGVISEALEHVATVARADGRFDDAGRFLGAADRLARQASYVRADLEQTLFERARARNREAAEHAGATDAFTRGYERGRLAPVDEVLAAARSVASAAAGGDARLVPLVDDEPPA